MKHHLMFARCVTTVVIPVKHNKHTLQRLIDPFTVRSHRSSGIAHMPRGPFMPIVCFCCRSTMPAALRGSPRPTSRAGRRFWRRSCCDIQRNVVREHSPNERLDRPLRRGNNKSAKVTLSAVCKG